MTGIRQQIVMVDLNVQKMQEKGVSLSQIQQALASDNIVVPAGEVSTNGQTHVFNILSKLHLVDRTQAAIYALQQQLVPLQDALEEE